MQKFSSIILIAFFSSSLAIAKKVPVNEKGESAVVATKLTKQAENSQDLRLKRRFGVGLLAASSLGMGGAQMELNFTRTWSMTLGYGGGGTFQAVQVQAKYALSGDWLIPYMISGFSSWKSNKNEGRIEEVNPAVLNDRLLTDVERNRGTFSKLLFYPGFGVQFLQLKGAWAGMSVFGEIVFLIDVETLNAGPTGGLGVLYYF